MPMPRMALGCAATIAAIALALAPAGRADAQTKSPSARCRLRGSASRLCAFIEGFFKAEGLDVSLVELQASAR